MRPGRGPLTYGAAVSTLVGVDLPRYEGAEVVVAGPRTGRGELGRRGERRAGRRRLLDGPPGPPPARRGPRRERRRLPLRRRACTSSPSPSVDRDTFGAASFERPVVLPAARRRLAALPELRDPGLQALVDRGARRRPARGPRRADAAASCCPATGAGRVKDPVVTVTDGRWEMWVCCHPLEPAGAEDRMVTAYATSPDGLDWSVQRHGPRGGARDAGTPAAPG